MIVNNFFLISCSVVHCHLISNIIIIGFKKLLFHIFKKMLFYNEEVEDHSCSCKAGHVICNHKVALMYQAAHNSRLKIDIVPEVPSKTSMPQEWHKPRSAGIHLEAVDRKPQLKSERGPKFQNRSVP